MSSDTEVISFEYDGCRPERLDRVVCAWLEAHPSDIEWTRSQVKNWIEKGNVKVTSVVVNKAGALIRRGAMVDLEVPLPVLELRPYEFDLDIVFEDESLIVINKPAGISMHPGAGEHEKTIANALVAHIGSGEGLPGDAFRPGIVHRLDKDTTGLVVIAKTLRSHNSLAAQFSSRAAGRRYHALVMSTPRGRRSVDLQDEGNIETLIGRHPTKRTLFAVVENNGKRAHTRWKVIERMNYAVLLELKLETGRTHQIRVHMSHLGSPVLGDRAYGDFSALPAQLRASAGNFGRQALHAAKLEFRHPVSDEVMEFVLDEPEDMKLLNERFRAFC